jgi:nitrite reductase (NADH) small subunit
MSNCIRIASKSELPMPGEAKEFSLADKVICVVNIEGRLAAMDNVCLHRGGSLGQGTVRKGKVICPWHGWAWDPLTGTATENPELKVTIYNLRIEGEDVLLTR